MTGAVYTKTYEPPPFHIREILRYAGAGKEPSGEAAELLQTCLEEVRGKLTYKVCFGEFPVSDCGGYLDLTFARTASTDLRRNLKGCRSIVLFAATVGLGLDRLIARYGSISPAKALIFQAIGAERIEALCDRFCGEAAERKRALAQHTRPRFSPGYGDLPMEIQRDIFRVLDCPRKIGLTLNESLLMSPSKSVTAMIGVGEDSAAGRETPSGCETCENKFCGYRKRV